MITAQVISKVLEENLAKIQKELGKENWSRFRNELIPLQQKFTSTTDRNALERAADSVWQACRRYPFIKALIHQHSKQYERKVQAGGTGHADEEPVAEIANRFQSLLARLEEIDLPDENANQPKTETANDHRTHP